VTDAEHPIDLLDEAPEADAVEQQQTPSDAAPTTAETTPTGTGGADTAEQQQPA
jgi:hypothetical protein